MREHAFGEIICQADPVRHCEGLLAEAEASSSSSQSVEREGDIERKGQERAIEGERERQSEGDNVHG